MMAGGPEDHFTDSRELYVLVEGDEWAQIEAPAAELVKQLKEIARLRAEGALTKSEFEAELCTTLSCSAGASRSRMRFLGPVW